MTDKDITKDSITSHALQHHHAGSSYRDPQEHFIDGPELPCGITRFWLVRHGVVEEKARETMYGTLDVPLCRASQKEQSHAYGWLARKLPPTPLWFSSPLARARQTALAIQEAGSFHRPIIREDAFREQSLGQWNGVPHRQFPALVKQKPHPFWSIAAEECPPQGESMDDVRQRVGQVLDSLAQAHDGQEMVVVSHGGAIRMALAHALGITPGQALHFTVQNLSCTILEHIAGQWRVVSVNMLPEFSQTEQSVRGASL